ncbi:hypothetical protein [Paenibacillus sp. XY044]|uniref:hypothetical protein n=1 Tax=Paenibacillus sp. XY044 TaxID=2026089 RepID=UPI000B9841CE|nr:hypothetical protein [Paenibacillus sp. XY044]OZB98113.1 hypothetical protein CJP46_02795 [Paenibacillus sp. XY044]
MNKIIEISKETFTEIERVIDEFECNKPPRNWTWGFTIEGDEETGYELYETHLESIVYPNYDVETHKDIIGRFIDKGSAELYVKAYNLLKAVIGQEDEIE